MPPTATQPRDDRWQFWIDRGGTFTDIVARRPDGTLASHKLLSDNPEQYADAALAGIRDLLGVARDAVIPAERIASVKMGTTVATNALLERKGDPTLLVTTAGFADALRIGTQHRPRLFDREIVLPEMLYARVVEAPERLAADGEVVTPLDRDAVTAALREAHAEGLRAVAICLLHGYRYPAHERAIAAIAREVGFTQVSVSHEVSPLMKLVGRGDTTVVDAYLSPILRRYIDRVAADLGGTRLMFMQSHGGLTDARLFQGRDAILSGPAGGVVGIVESAAITGLDRIVGFDMGGTSTDVSHFAGAYERTLDSLVAGVRVRAPMMQIHTVAAGGGSLLHFTDGRLQVGPASAGADPGPACYRRGGPLAVTDCNVLLGKLQPEHFPRVFGPRADQALDPDVVRERFAALAAEIEAETGVPQAAEPLAEGFLRIAVENMANAIKQISVQRGYDVTEYTLASFGGAGGQHACLVADALGIERIFLHPLAGVLSAYGMGLADLRALRERSVEAPLHDAALEGLAAELGELADEACEELRAQGIAEERVTVLRHLLLRYEGTDSALKVDWDSPDGMHTAFTEQHHQLFGFTMEGRDLVVAAIAVEAIGATGARGERELERPGTPGDPEPIDEVRMHAGGGWHATPVFARERLQPGHVVDGPAIVVEPTATTVVEPGWRATVNGYGHLLLERVAARPHSEVVGTEADPVLLEVFNNLFMSIAEQMGAALANTAYSVNIKERLDFSCALFDANGRLVANAPHMPVHLGSMGESVRAVLREHGETMRPGDSYVLNAPYNGGTHLPDVTVVTPVYDAEGGERLFCIASRGHHADIGGITPGSMPPTSRTVDEEGVLLDNLLLVRDGRLREAEIVAELEAGPYPSRNVRQNLADLRAQVAANAKGVGELRKMVDHFGLDVVRAYMGHVQANAEESVRRAIDRLRPGRFTVEMDDGNRIRVAISVDPATRTATLDFDGTSPQSDGNGNAPRAVCRAAALYVFRTLVDAEIPMNEGCLAPLVLEIPDGSLLAPRYPAAVVAGNVETSQQLCDALYGALGVLAAAQGTMNNFTFGNDRHQYYETLCGGAGAGDGFAGCDAVHTHMTNSRLTDPEVLEWRFPVRVEAFSIRRGSGGAGRWCGGNGVVRRIRFLEPMTAAILSNRRRIAPHGLAGGEPGEPGRNYVIRADGRVEALPGTAQVELDTGDQFVVETPGGGGYGPPSG
ncbi:MAG: hydantoinase B/oxoprolinase family protein [Gammaproteobacteria bacterium]|nr:hydantoinase B/oxoprolinase family protein [Gammaproteobacteria bacterium]